MQMLPPSLPRPTTPVHSPPPFTLDFSVARGAAAAFVLLLPTITHSLSIFRSLSSLKHTAEMQREEDDDAAAPHGAAAESNHLVDPGNSSGRPSAGTDVEMQQRARQRGTTGNGVPSPDDQFSLSSTSQGAAGGGQQQDEARGSAAAGASGLRSRGGGRKYRVWMVILGVIFAASVVMIVVSNFYFLGGAKNRPEITRSPAPSATTSEAPTAATPTTVEPSATVEPPPLTPQWEPSCPRNDLFDANGAALNVTVEEQRLRQYTELLLSYGPRVGGSQTAGYNKSHSMLSTMSACDGYWNVSYDNFTENTVIGTRTFSNIIARFRLGNLSKGHLVIAAHYDSKLYNEFRFVGACDAAVPCVMILDMMKRASTVAAAEGPANIKSLPKITVVFFDGEEAFRPQWQGTDNTYGSRHLAERWAKEGRLVKISHLMLLDLIGPKNPTFHNYYAHDSGKAYAQISEIEAQMQRDGELLTGRSPRNPFFPAAANWPVGVIDDHTPFQQRGVSILYVTPSPFPTVWHHPSDDESSVHYPTVRDLQAILWRFVRNFSESS